MEQSVVGRWRVGGGVAGAIRSLVNGDLQLECKMRIWLIREWCNTDLSVVRVQWNLKMFWTCGKNGQVFILINVEGNRVKKITEQVES